MEVFRRLLRHPSDAALYGGLDSVGGAGVDDSVVDGGQRGLEGGRFGEERGRQDVQLPAEDEDAVGGGVRVEPAREREGGLDEEEVPVGVPRARDEVREGAGEREEEGDGEPLVGEGVAEAERAVEVRQGRRGAERAGGGGVGGEGEREGVAMEEVGGEEGGEVGEEREVEGLEGGEEGGSGQAGGERERVDGVEEGVVRRAAGREREGVGGGGGGGHGGLAGAGLLERRGVFGGAGFGSFLSGVRKTLGAVEGWKLRRCEKALELGGGFVGSYRPIGMQMGSRRPPPETRVRC